MNRFRTVAYHSEQILNRTMNRENVLNGSAGISVSLAMKLEAQGWSRADVWIRLQGAYDLAQARKRTGQWPVEDPAFLSA